LLKKYKAKLDLKIGKTQKPSKKNDEPEFEEFSLSD